MCQSRDETPMLKNINLSYTAESERERENATVKIYNLHHNWYIFQASIGLVSNF